MSVLDQHRYISIATKKHDGSWVWTPVWFAFHAGAYYLFSAGAAGKVKRIRNYEVVQLAPCTASGKILGSSVNGKAWFEADEADASAAYAALRDKYGWQMRMLDFFSKLSGNYVKRQLIGFSVSTEEG